ncbi:MAG: dephospho-CoA kinase [Thiotrichaceae bacterium]
MFLICLQSWALLPSLMADIISHQLVTGGQPALTDIVQIFGTEMLQSDGNLNRIALRQRIFADV